MKKHFIYIIAATMAIGMLSPLARMAEGDSPIITACEGDTFTPPEVENRAYSAREIRQLYNEANQDYHSYIQCIFDEAMGSMLSSFGGNPDDYISGLSTTARNYMQPSQACLDPSELNKIVLDSAPEKLLPSLLGAYNNYKTFLSTLIDKSFDRQAIEVQEDGSFDFLAAAQGPISIKNDFENEIQDALIGMDNAFVALKEMRLAFAMHVQLQCLLGNLEDYRDVLAETRKKILQLPGLLLDASCA